MSNRLGGRRVAVTGASGFIGARTVEHLILAADCEVHAVVRSFSRLSRLSELAQDRLSFHRSDVLDTAALTAALSGCDIVVHCAYGSDGSPEQQWQTTVHGTRTLVDVAARVGTTRVVHVSTAAVHDVTDLDVFDETTPLVRPSYPTYEAAKLAAEAIVHGAGLDAITLRPTVVYGPWGKDWTATVLDRLARGGRGLPSGSDSGISNAVYVDDVARAIVLACASDCGGAVLIGSDEIVPWGRFYDAFRALVTASDAAADDEAVDAWEQSLYAQRARVNIERARRLLGYQPRASFDEGIAMVRAWNAWCAHHETASFR
jgi:nucleoside-diphosphate-sugar epimerase